jgi:8-oxo-dGTP diphosphatase
MTDFTTEALPPRPRVAVDLIVVRTIDDAPHVLLITVSKGLYVDMEALPGGGVEPGELIAAAALRELAEETDLAAETLDLFFLGYYDKPSRDVRERVISFAFMVDADRLAERGGAEPVAGSDAASVQWAPLAGLLGDADRGNFLAYDHSLIVFEAANVIASKDLWPPHRTNVTGTGLRDRV